MQITYGVDTLGDNAVDQYMDATAVALAGRWPDVLTVQLQFLLASAEDGITAAAQVYTFNGTATTAGDRRMYQVFTSTIGVRNRLP